MKTILIIMALCISFVFINGINNGFSDDITIVCIDKETIEKIGPYPFSRDRYADFLESLYSHYSPQCVYFNLIIYQYKQGSIESDKQLFKAINGKKNVFFSFQVTDTRLTDTNVEHTLYERSQFNKIKNNRMWRAEGAVLPLAEIVQNGAYISISDVGLNKRGIVERMPTVVQLDKNTYLSTPLFLTAAYLDIAPAVVASGNSIGLGNKKLKTDRTGWFEIDFNHKFRKYSYHDILNNEAQKELIDGRIILFGIDNPELEAYLSVSRNKRIPGVEVIANATQTLIDQLRQ